MVFWEGGWSFGSDEEGGDFSGVMEINVIES
jgi:hypothetical protein